MTTARKVTTTQKVTTTTARKRAPKKAIPAPTPETETSRPRLGLRIVNFLREWPAHITTVVLITVAFIITPDQTLLVFYKACAPMIGALGGYWLFVFFVGRDPDFDDTHERYQVIAFMCAGMLAMRG